MTTPRDVYWDPYKTVAWHRGFEVRLADVVGAQRTIGFYLKPLRPIAGVSGNTVLVERFKGRLKSDVDRQIRSKVIDLLKRDWVGYAPVDTIPWEIHRIQGAVPRTEATKAYLMTTEVTVESGFSWPPFTSNKLKLVFPDGDLTNPKIRL